VLHLGDHDPSGIDMTRDIEERLAMFGANTIVERIALNMDQVRQYNPPPNPAKVTDTRFKAYQRRYGVKSWELDALDPRTLANLIQATIIKYRDESAWRVAVTKEEAERKDLSDIYTRYQDVTAFLGDLPPVSMLPKRDARYAFYRHRGA